MLIRLTDIIIAYSFIFLPLILGVAHARRKDRPRKEMLLVYYLFISVGIQGLFTGIFQIAFPDNVVDFLQWPYSPFLDELGLANISFGVLGILSLWQDKGWKSATAIGYGLFLFMTGLYHLIEIFHTGMEPAHMGGFLVSDLLVPVALFILVGLI